jgi:pimeloyl-ACP methyl ester carboxylesterase
MARFEHGGIGLAYDDMRPATDQAGTILLVHGFAASRDETWRRLGWLAAFERKSWRVIAMDLRGHGESDKPHEAAAYGRAVLADDLVAVLDHLGVNHADVLGYSMGAHLALGLALRNPDRIDRLILGGVGGRLIDGGGPMAQAKMTMAEAMRTPDPEAIPDKTLKGFRLFADQEGADRLALAACSEGSGRSVTTDDFAAIPSPTLIVAGALDDIAGDPQRLADAFPDARSIVLPGCDHFSTTPHALFKASVFDFLEGWMDVPDFG